MAKNDLMSVGVDKEGQLVLRKKIKGMALMATLRAAALYCWHGSLLERPLCQPDAAQDGGSKVGWNALPETNFRRCVQSAGVRGRSFG